jgi:ABC-type antimicrobial peptide transport system permease subunit
VGTSIADRFPEARLNQRLKFAGNDWTVVGIFTTDGTGFDSEIWGDGLQMLDAFNRGSTVSTMTVKLDDPANFEQFKENFTDDRRLNQFEPKREREFFAEQSQGMSTFIRILGIFITVIFSIGAIAGAMITMYTAVANRTVEIGTLRSLGFRRRSILGAFLIESMVIAMSGAALGLFIASFLQFFTISTLNFQSFSELSFSFALSPSIITTCLIFAILMGLFGGFLPSVRASRLKIVDALRAS